MKENEIFGTDGQREYQIVNQGETADNYGNADTDGNRKLFGKENPYAEENREADSGKSAESEGKTLCGENPAGYQGKSGVIAAGERTPTFGERTATGGNKAPTGEEKTPTFGERTPTGGENAQGDFTDEQRERLGRLITDVIDRYVEKINRNTPPKVLSGASGAFVPTEPRKPKTIDEANEIAKSFLFSSER